MGCISSTGMGSGSAVRVSLSSVTLSATALLSETMGCISSTGMGSGSAVRVSLSSVTLSATALLSETLGFSFIKILAGA